MFIGGACAWATPSTLATFSLGDAFFPGDASPWRRLLSWRRLDWATPSPRRHLTLATLLLSNAFFMAMPVAASNRKKIKTKNQGKVFLELVFPFIWVTSLKNPGKGKKSVPFNKTVTLLT